MEITTWPKPLQPTSPNSHPPIGSLSSTSHPGIFSRTFADVVDLIICGYVAALLVKYVLFLFPFGFESVWIIFLLFLFAVYTVYSTISLGLTAATLGKSIFGIKLLKLSGAEPTLWDAFLREVIYKPLSILPIGMGYAAALFNQDGLTWHDHLSRTQTVSPSSPNIGQTITGVKKIFMAVLVVGFFLVGEVTFGLGVYGEITAEDLPINLCYFDFNSPYSYGYSTHFDVFAEEGNKSTESFEKLRRYLEQAYDYSFYLVAPITAKISRAEVCFYQEKESFEGSFTAHGGGYFPAFAYFSPRDFTVHFSAEFLDSDLETQKNTIYHEINHFVLHLFLEQNGYYREIPYWFVEGFAELVGNFYGESYQDLGPIKYSVGNNFRSWETLSTYEAIDEDFSPYDFYAEGFLSVMFLEDKYGQGIFKTLLQEMIENDREFYPSLENVTQSSLASLQREFLQWLSK